MKNFTLKILLILFSITSYAQTSFVNINVEISEDLNVTGILHLKQKNNINDLKIYKNSAGKNKEGTSNLKIKKIKNFNI